MVEIHTGRNRTARRTTSLAAYMMALVVVVSCLTYRRHSSVVRTAGLQQKDHHLAYPDPEQEQQQPSPALNSNNRREDTKHQRGALRQPSAALSSERTPWQLRLRYDWTNLSPSLDLTKNILRHQSNCSVPVGTFTYRNRFGLGSDLHTYALALGNGIEANRRIRTVGNWTWMDRDECGREGSGATDTPGRGREPFGTPLGSPMRCYFVASELNCPGDLEHALANPAFDPEHGLSRPNGNVLVPSGDYASAILPSKKDGGEQKLATAVVESLFVRTAPRVVREAERQLNLVFGGRDGVPKDLITVHIRWGDKVTTYQGKKRKRLPEMKKVGISDYIQAVRQILDKRTSSSKSATHTNFTSTEETANIYLATEDPRAVDEFRKALPKGWNLFVDQFLVDTSDHRVDEYNGVPKMAKSLNGRLGLLALGSLLVGMEANDFVLTTASNWSRLMNELRQSILDPRCGECTSAIDLRPQ